MGETSPYLKDAPIGSIIAFAKSFSGVPSLSNFPNWVECNGQVLNDPLSPLNGKTMPSLNSTNRFLYGDTTSGTVTNQTYLPAHTHTMDLFVSTGDTFVADTISGLKGNAAPFPAGTGTTNANTPSGLQWTAYSVVWIIKIK
jgi:hypothetical protein